jgi:hypothetical protein
VTELPPLNGPFCTHADPTAASKLYAALAVPARPPTLTADMPCIAIAVRLKHTSVVAELHDDVPQTTISSALVALRSTEPKPSPLTVTELPPLQAPFRTQPDPTAASKLSALQPVPARAATVTVTPGSTDAAARALQLTVVAELHDVVVHTPSASCAEPVGSADAKPSPIIVTDAPPVHGTFGWMPWLATAASKVRWRMYPEPTTEATVNAPGNGSDDPATPVGAGRHATVVLDVHEVVRHAEPASDTEAVCSSDQNSSPLNRTELPLQGTLLELVDRSGASNVSDSDAVEPGTLRCSVRLEPPVHCASTAVADVQAIDDVTPL